MSEESKPIPKEIGRSGEHDLKIEWRDGRVSVLPARLLRQKCPCAMCVDEMTGRRTLDPDSVDEDVHPLGIELVGRYAIRIRWSDNHSSGIYTFQLLRQLDPGARESADPEGE
ncbi:MAG TPA: DUF971 domain-containing protein [Acidobacteriota bacterium]|nr:DUF971 domain-containing protein [Acidobacteriota bacterium]